MEDLLEMFILAAIDMKYTFILFIIEVEYFIETHLRKIMYMGIFSMYAYLYFMGEGLREFEIIILNSIIIIFSATILGQALYDYKKLREWNSLSDSQRKKIMDDITKGE